MLRIPPDGHGAALVARYQVGDPEEPQRGQCQSLPIEGQDEGGGQAASAMWVDFMPGGLATPL